MIRNMRSNLVVSQFSFELKDLEHKQKQMNIQGYFKQQFNLWDFVINGLEYVLPS